MDANTEGYAVIDCPFDYTATDRSRHWLCAACDGHIIVIGLRHKFGELGSFAYISNLLCEQAESERILDARMTAKRRAKRGIE